MVFTTLGVANLYLGLTLLAFVSRAFSKEMETTGPGPLFGGILSFIAGVPLTIASLFYLLSAFGLLLHNKFARYVSMALALPLVPFTWVLRLALIPYLSANWVVYMLAALSFYLVWVLIWKWERAYAAAEKKQHRQECLCYMRA